MIELKEATFEYDGFECKVRERPDLLNLRQVNGHRESDNRNFLSKLLFERHLSFEQIREAFISEMKGELTGTIIPYGRYAIYTGA